MIRTQGRQPERQKSIRFNEYITLFFVHFFTDTARLQRESDYVFFLGRNSTSNDEFFFLFLKVYKALRNKFNSRKVRIHLTK